MFFLALTLLYASIIVIFLELLYLAIACRLSYAMLGCRGARTGQSKQYAVEKYGIELRVYYLEAAEYVGTRT